MASWKRSTLYAAACVMVAGLTACSTDRDMTRDGAPLARQLTASHQCGFDHQGLIYIDSRQRLASLPEDQGGNLVVAEDHDFSAEPLILVAAGSKRSGGYGVVLEGSRIRDGVLELGVDVSSPGADQTVTMALTSPCAVLAVTADGWSSARVSGPGFSELSFRR